MQCRAILAPLLAACVTSGCLNPSAPSAPAPRAEERTPVPPSPQPPAQGTCDATKVQWAIGHAASADLLERARVAAGAGTARFLRPNQPITTEYLGSRLNLNLDARDVVSSAGCG